MKECVVVGALGPVPRYGGTCYRDEPLCLGKMQEEGDSSGAHDQCIMFACDYCESISFHAESGSWRCRLSGCYDGNGHMGALDTSPILDLWIEAGNSVQWRPRS